MENLEKLKQWVADSRQIVFFGGAGVSTESGIRDFRSVDGLYSQKFDYPPETIISHSFYLKNPEYFFRFYREKMLPLGHEPNITHKKLAQWEREGKLAAVVTQNIDGLHQKAGSKTVYELHGSVLRNYCTRCGKFYPAEFIRDTPGIPRCTCGGIVKPDVVLYEEALDQQTLENSVCAIRNADMLPHMTIRQIWFCMKVLVRYFPTFNMKNEGCRRENRQPSLYLLYGMADYGL